MRAPKPRAIRLALGSAVIAALALGIAAPGLAGPYYLKLGDIKGEADSHQAEGHGDEIDVLSWQWVATPRKMPVEREMKESGEKAGTEDINIGVGELQKGRGGNAETTWKVEKGEKAASGDPDRPVVTGREAARTAAARKGRRKVDRDAAGMVRLVVPEGTCQKGARYEDVVIGSDEGRYRLLDVRVVSCTPRDDADDRATEEVAFYYNRIE